MNQDEDDLYATTAVFDDDAWTEARNAFAVTAAESVGRVRFTLGRPRLPRLPRLPAVHLELDSVQDGVHLMGKVESDDNGYTVPPKQLARGLGLIVDRHSRLEVTAERYGMSVDELLDSLENTAVDVADASFGIPEAELAAIHAAGIRLEGSRDDPSGAAQVARGLAHVHQFQQETLSVSQAAKQLGISDSRVRQHLTNGTLMSILSSDNAHRLPAWQLHHGEVLPGIRHIAHAAAGVHPLTLARFMTRGNIDLQIDEKPVAPVDWLASGGNPETVADLTAALHLPT